MNTLSIDTHRTIQKLMKKGYTEEQAEGLIDALTESNIATKNDLKELELRLTVKLYGALLIHGLAVVAAVLAAANAL